MRCEAKSQGWGGIVSYTQRQRYSIGSGFPLIENLYSVRGVIDSRQLNVFMVSWPVIFHRVVLNFAQKGQILHKSKCKGKVKCRKILKVCWESMSCCYKLLNKHLEYLYFLVLSGHGMGLASVL